NYAGLEPITITDLLNAADIVLSNNDDFDAVLQPSGGGLSLSSASSTFESLSFAVPSVSLTIHGGDGHDIISLSGALSLGSIPLTIAAEEIVMGPGSPLTTGGAVTFQAVASTAGSPCLTLPVLGIPLPTSLCVTASPHASITITGATISAASL